MKNNVITTIGAGILTLSAATAEETSEVIGTITTTSISKGEITVSKYVRQDVKPTITWDLTLKETIEDIIERRSDGKLQLLKDSTITVTVLGTGVTSGSGDDYTSYTTKGEIQVGSGDWITVHEGNENGVVPGKVVYTADIEEGQTIGFRAAYYNKKWKNTRYESSDEILTLINGEIIPTNKPSNEAVSSAEDFLKPLMNDDSTISIGDLDIIYVCELTHSDESDSGYDLQDLIIHVSFTSSETEVEVASN